MQGLGDKKEFGTRPQRETVAFCAFGVATLCRCAQLRDRVGRDGTNWVNIGVGEGWATDLGIALIGKHFNQKTTQRNTKLESEKRKYRRALE
jgi:hypothetical protein